MRRFYFSDLLNRYSKNTKETWKNSNSITNTKNTKSMTFFNNGKVIDNKQAVVPAFNDYLINIAHELMQNISNTNANYLKIFVNNRNNNSMFLFTITEKELIDVINKYKSKKSSDWNEFGMKMITKVINLITKPLTNTFNKSFNSGKFPEEMKIAKVIPVFKTCKKTIFGNYIPISVLSKFSKIFLTLFDKRLESLLKKHNILSENQYGL